MEPPEVQEPFGPGPHSVGILPRGPRGKVAAGCRRWLFGDGAGARGESSPHCLQSMLQTRTSEHLVCTPAGRLDTRMQEEPSLHGEASPARRQPPALLPSWSSRHLWGHCPPLDCSGPHQPPSAQTSSPHQSPSTQASPICPRLWGARVSTQVLMHSRH